MKIRSFTDLVAWQEGHKLVLLVYKITTTFPRNEAYSLTNQMRRSVMSITNNLAEGFSRKGNKEKKQFSYLALGSTTELQNQLLIARDLSYITNDQFQKLAQQTIVIHKLINGMIKYSSKHI